MSAADALLNSITALVNSDNVEKVIDLQEVMLHKLEKTNEMLRTVSELSVQRYKVLSEELLGHVQTIHRLKKELGGIFKRIHALKSFFTTQYPEEMEQFNQHISDPFSSEDRLESNCTSVPQDAELPLPKRMETVREETSAE